MHGCMPALGPIFPSSHTAAMHQSPRAPRREHAPSAQKEEERRRPCLRPARCFKPQGGAPPGRRRCMPRVHAARQRADTCGPAHACPYAWCPDSHERLGCSSQPRAHPRPPKTNAYPCARRASPPADGHSRRLAPGRHLGPPPAAVCVQAWPGHPPRRCRRASRRRMRRHGASAALARPLEVPERRLGAGGGSCLGL